MGWEGRRWVCVAQVVPLTRVQAPMSALVLWPLFTVRGEPALPGPVPRVPWEMPKRGYPRGAHFSPLTLKSLDGWGCFAVEMQSLEIKFSLCAPTQPQRCTACFSEHEDAAVPSLVPREHIRPEQDNTRREVLQYLSPIEAKHHRYKHQPPPSTYFTCRRGTTRGSGIPKKGCCSSG